MRWRKRPEGSNWGDFGPNDQVGRLNLITPARRKAAAQEVREGIAFILSLPLDFPRGTGLAARRKPPKLFTTGHDHGCRVDNVHIDIGSDDGVIMALQYSSQWDALCHMGALFDADDDGIAEPLFYNGFRVGEDVGSDATGAPQARKLGIETIAETGVQGRGVLVNLFDAIGRERVAVGYDQLMRLMEAQRVSVEPGDMLCLYTGLADLVLELDDGLTGDVVHNSCAVLDGHDERLRRWIDESGIAALIADNMGIEAWGGAMRDEGDVMLPLHHLCLFKLGIPMGELWHLAKLAQWLKANGRSRFLLTAPPLRLPGAVGSPATGVATV